MSIQDFHQRVAVVTGAGSGIGEAIAEALAAAGATVVVADVDEAAAQRTATRVGGVAQVVDVARADSVQQLADTVLRDLGRVDVLVNNAGVGPLATFDDLTPEDFRWVMDINFWGVVHGLHSFLPHLLANPAGGHVVNTASVAAFLPAAGTSAYAASKAAVVAMSETLAIELSAAGRVGVSLLLPAPVRTNITTNAEKRPGQHPGAARTSDFLPPLPELEASVVGQMVVEGIREGRLHIFTHPETRVPIAARMQELASAHPASA